MKTRIISGVAALLLLAIVMFLGKYAFGAVVFLLALIGIHEFYNAMKSGGYKPVRIMGYISCLPLLYLTFGNSRLSLNSIVDYSIHLKILALFVFLVLSSLLCLLIFKHEKYNIADAAITILGIIYVVFLFSFLILVRSINGRGDLFIWLVFAGAWVPDTAAYFTGVALGKTKILPVVSPKKSLEGSIGGIAGCVAVMTGIGLFLNSLGIYGAAGIPFFHYIILGLLCGAVSQIGDWAASAIKRYVAVKDYGNLMPGHGGVLDRFDSILFAAPVVYFYLSLCLGV